MRPCLPFAALVLALLPLPGWAATLNVVVDGTRIEMGKYLNARIVYTGEGKVDAADLSRWGDAFFVEHRYREHETLEGGAVRTTQHVRLYPRAVGTGVLAPIALGGRVAAPPDLTVLPAVRDGIDGTPRWLPLPDRIWQGQTIEIGVEMALLHPDNRISVEQPELPGFRVASLPAGPRPGVPGVKVLLRWRLTPLVKGNHTVDLPPIVQRGRGHWRFHLPLARIDVDPLPSYLPATVPVGEVSLQTAVIRVAGLPYWEAAVSNRGLLPPTVYGLRTALAEGAGRSPEAVEVAPVEADPVAGTALQYYRVAVPAWSFGWAEGPPLALRYFDTHKGRVVTLQRNLPAVWRLPAYAVYMLVAVGLVLFLAAGRVVYCRVRRVHAVRRFRRSVQRARDAHELRHLLLASGEHVSLGAWADAMRDTAAGRLAGRINAACFSDAPGVSLSSLKAEAGRLRVPLPPDMPGR